MTTLVPPRQAALMPARADGTDLGVVAVRVLCDFAARRGDLDLRFTPSPSGAEGVEGHSAVTARRGPGYQREVPLAHVHRGLRLQGRADGWDPGARRLEEIKTHRGDAALIGPERRALHWAQARVYGWMLAEQLGLEGLEIALIYYDLDSGRETVLAEHQGREALRDFVDELCERYAAWARQEVAHRQARDAALGSLTFPWPAFRPGQRALAAATYRAHRDGRVLLAEAPTGIGKTMATLFGALRALPLRGTDRLYYLTARTTGRALALDGLRRLGAGAVLPLRVLERRAREQACEHPDKACHGESCPLARGFYDRLPAARQQAAQAQWLDHEALRAVALTHDVCPYYLGQEMLRWCDVAVGDYHHVFDPNGAWLVQAEEDGRSLALLVDEAHHLIGRARDMYSAALDPADFQPLRRAAPAALRPALQRLHRQWNALAPRLQGAHTELEGPPAEWVQALRLACSDIADALAHPGVIEPAVAEALLPWFFDAQRWLRLADGFGEHSACDLTPCRRSLSGLRTAQPVVGLRNLVPAPLLASRWRALHGATLFSATLSPLDHVATMLGLPEGWVPLRVPSPFDPGRLRVCIAADVSTRWGDRTASLPALCEVMARQFHERPGNYLAFFSSFEYLAQAFDDMGLRYPDIPRWAQSRGMDEAARRAFLARFAPGGRGIGFAVLGGAFGEGIDLPGDRLIGAFIATLGLPQVDAFNEMLRRRVQAQFGHGYEHTYLYPGLQKVVQAAGRVIRSEHDHGTVWLIDERFAQPRVRALLPPHWRVQAVRVRDATVR